MSDASVTEHNIGTYENVLCTFKSSAKREEASQSKIFANGLLCRPHQNWLIF